MANASKTIYVGVTNNLLRRIYEHKQKLNIDSFTCRYNLNRLVYFEEFDDIGYAINREKQLKSYKRSWKVELVEEENPEWKDFSEGWY